VLVRVERRRGDELYINDGAYGALFDAAHVDWRYPVALVRRHPSRARDIAFAFYGPTCDDMDHMKGPFALPADVQPGDFIEIGQLGAYGQAMRTGVNGFGASRIIAVSDAPMCSLIPSADAVPEALPANVTPLFARRTA
jgi:ornithine decarboxylase